jgi:beta-glucosidase
MPVHDSFVKQTMEHKADIEIVFLGDSITQYWASEGKEVWNKYYAPRHAYNYGIGGDKTENVIWRIEHKEFDGLSPKVVVLKIGKKYSYVLLLLLNYEILNLKKA